MNVIGSIALGSNSNPFINRAVATTATDPMAISMITGGIRCRESTSAVFQWPLYGLWRGHFMGYLTGRQFD
jgi:hypothetical protein